LTDTKLSSRATSRGSFAAKGEGRHGAMAVADLARPGGDSRLDQPHQLVRQKLRVDAEITMLPEGLDRPRGTLPEPICKVAPSGMRSATNSSACMSRSATG